MERKKYKLTPDGAQSFEKIFSQSNSTVKTEFNLSRFTEMHKQHFKIALSEIKNGKKETHWMWYIFPQIIGLGKSETAVFYSIKSIHEAAAFLDDPYLGKNLRKICQELLELPINNAKIIFGDIDKKKLRSSMTLFLFATKDNALFKAILDKFFEGSPDCLTINLLRK